ncbi:MAG: type IV secretion system protein [Sphingomonadaceae bacterium]
MTGLLTVFVSLFGYRLLFGHTPGVRDGVLVLVKIGIVLALATNWAAYRTLVYDVALKGPAQLAADIGSPSGLPGAGGGLVPRLDYTDRAFVALAIAGASSAANPQVARPPAMQAMAPGAAPQMLPGFDALALGASRMMYLVGAIGALASVRLVAGLLLALGPFFVTFLLFDGTRGLFEGWVRVLAGTFLGALGAAIVLGVELALLEPWLADLLALRAANLPISGTPTELLVVTLVFALALLAILIAAARVALGFRLSPIRRSGSDRLVAAIRGEEPRIPVAVREAGIAPAESRSRAATVVDAVAASQRREAALAAGLAAQPSRGVGRHIAVHDRSVPSTPVPIGQSFRRTRARVSASAGRRDRGA